MPPVGPDDRRVAGIAGHPAGNGIGAADDHLLGAIARHRGAGAGQAALAGEIEALPIDPATQPDHIARRRRRQRGLHGGKRRLDRACRPIIAIRRNEPVPRRALVAISKITIGQRMRLGFRLRFGRDNHIPDHPDDIRAHAHRIADAIARGIQAAQLRLSRQQRRHQHPGSTGAGDIGPRIALFRAPLPDSHDLGLRHPGEGRKRRVHDIAVAIRAGRNDRRPHQPRRHVERRRQLDLLHRQMKDDRGALAAGTDAAHGDRGPCQRRGRGDGQHRPRQRDAGNHRRHQPVARPTDLAGQVDGVRPAADRIGPVRDGADHNGHRRPRGQQRSALVIDDINGRPNPAGIGGIGRDDLAQDVIAHLNPPGSGRRHSAPSAVPGRIPSGGS